MTEMAQLTRIKLQKGRYLVKRGEIWYLETCVKGLQERHSLGTSELQEATRLAMRRRGKSSLMPGQQAGKPGAPAALNSNISIVDIHKKDTQSERDQGSISPLQPSAFLILLAIGRGQAHGYAIMQEIEQLSGGQLRMGPGTLYRSVQRMLVDNLIEEIEEQGSEGGDERRRVYRLTKLGLSVVREEGLRLDVLLKAAKARGLTPKA
jgi:DNA-binding PadR family transcriptional regulator